MPPEPIKIYNNIDEGPPTGWTIFIYGDWGSGKSVLARGAPNSLMIDTEGSRQSFKNHPELAVLPFVIARTPLELINLAQKIKSGSPGLDSFDTYIVDTVSALRSTSITQSVVAARGRNVASQAEYSEVNQLISQVIMLRRERPEKNWIFIGHMQLEKNKEGAIIQTRPSLGEATIQIFGQNCDAIMYLRAQESSTGNTVRELITFNKGTGDQGKVMAKDRLNLPNVIPNPTSAELFGLIEQQHNRKVTNE